MSDRSNSQLDLFSASVTAPDKSRARTSKQTSYAFSSPKSAPPQSPAQAHLCQYLNDRAVAQRYGVSRPSIWRWTKSLKGFPEPIKFSEGTTRWAVGDLERFDMSHLGSAAPSVKEANK